jgi:hypothetical protein
MARFQNYPLQVVSVIALLSAALGAGAHIMLARVEASWNLARLLHVIVWVGYTTAGLLSMLLVASVVSRIRVAAAKPSAMRHHVTQAHRPSQRPEQRRLIRRQRPLDPDQGGWT